MTSTYYNNNPNPFAVAYATPSLTQLQTTLSQANNVFNAVTYKGFVSMTGASVGPAQVFHRNGFPLILPATSTVVSVGINGRGTLTSAGSPTYTLSLGNSTGGGLVSLTPAESLAATNTGYSTTVAYGTAPSNIVSGVPYIWVNELVATSTAGEIAVTLQCFIPS